MAPLAGSFRILFLSIETGFDPAMIRWCRLNAQDQHRYRQSSSGAILKGTWLWPKMDVLFLTILLQSLCTPDQACGDGRTMVQTLRPWVGPESMLSASS